MNWQPKTQFSDAWLDISAALLKYHLIFILGWQDVATRYRRSRVGAFWLTISMAILIAVLGFVFGTLFKQPMNEFLPYLATGLVIWGFMSSVINESCTGFISAGGIILQVRLPLFTHVMRILWRNIIIMGHNILILPILFLIFMKPVSLEALLAVPGFALLIANVGWMMLILAVLCTRYRDITQMVANFIQVMFYVTPIIWSVDLLPQQMGAMMLDFNPLYHLISVVRTPLLGEFPTLLNWMVSISMMIVGWIVALVFFGHYRKRVSYWL